MIQNSFIHKADNTVSINGVTIPIEVLKIFDPNYTLPTGIKSVRYTVHPTLRTGYHFQHDGSRNLRAEHPCPVLDHYIANLQSIKAIADDVKQDSIDIEQLFAPYTEKRKSEYPAIEELVVALWELVVEANPTAMQRIQEIQTRRLHTKQKYPANRINNGVDSDSGSSESDT